MKVILRENVKGKGIAGDIIDVKTGYARNYLVPQGFAYQATDKNMKIYEHEKACKTKEQETFRKDTE